MTRFPIKAALKVNSLMFFFIVITENYALPHPLPPQHQKMGDFCELIVKETTNFKAFRDIAVLLPSLHPLAQAEKISVTFILHASLG